MVNRAIDTHKTYQISYWDALIFSASERAGCTSILSEDLSDGQTYHNIVDCKIKKRYQKTIISVNKVSF